MKKIIRLSESELVSLVKRTIMEETIDNEKINKEFLLYNKLLNYSGFHKEIYKLKEKYQAEKNLTNGDLVYLEGYFKDDEEKPKTSDNLIMDLGTETYLRMVLGEKQNLFKIILGNETNNYKVSKPKNSWFVKNIGDLETFRKTFGTDTSDKKIKFPGDFKFMTLNTKIDLLINRCENQDYIGILEIEPDDLDKEEWSILNKIDTNLINWKNSIKEKNLNVNVGADIWDYFKQRKLDSTATQNLKKTYKIDAPNLKTMSYAEFDLLSAFTDETGNKLNKIKKSINLSTDKGNQTEKEFLHILQMRKNDGYDIKIVNFSEPGNIVDTNLGVDMIVTIKGVPYAVQIKSSEEAAKKYLLIKKLGIRYMAIFPKNNGFGYFSNSNPTEFKDFDTDFLSHKYED
jgi:SPP1 family predicted phage head-tail adaptor